MIVASAIAILTTIGIVLSLIFETLRFFNKVPVMDFLFGLSWSPQIAIREDQVGGSGSFGAIPLFAGTMMITFIAMLVAVPIGLMSAVYLSEYANPKLRHCQARHYFSRYSDRGLRLFCPHGGTVFAR